MLGEDDRFCDNPWVYCEIYSGGNVYICCPAWNYNVPVGNVFTQTPQQIWDSVHAQRFRQGILNGSFGACDHAKCPHLLARSLPTVAKARESWVGEILSDAIDNNRIQAIRGPAVVKLGYDTSCNLTCPSCRSAVIMAEKAEQNQLNRLRDQFILSFLEHAKILVMSSDGDPFASSHYRDIMRLTCEKLPDLRLGLCTNGMLLNERAWEDCHLEGRVSMVQVSVDAATAETYSYLRRGGSFDRLKSNLAFISCKRRGSATFNKYDLLFVVQTRNFREMPAFVELGESVGADTVQFMLIDHWGRGMDTAAYRRAKIWDQAHPDYSEFAALLRDEIFQRPIVRLGNVAAVARSEQPPELRVNFDTGMIDRVPHADRQRGFRGLLAALGRKATCTAKAFLRRLPGT